LRIKSCNDETPQPSKNIACISEHQLNVNPAKSCAAPKLFRDSNVIRRSNALLSAGIAESASSFETFITQEGVHKLPDFVIALVHPTTAFSHNSEMEFHDDRN
jgi:hypothetical protein